LKATGLDDETVVRKAYERYNGKTDFEANSREANENMLLDMYLSVISNPMNFAEARQPLDTVTDYLKDKILKDVDKLTGQGKRTSKSQLYFSTPAFQSRTKAELNGGKFGIGPFALANAHQVLTQLVKLNFKPNKVLSDYGIRDLHHIQSEDTNKINVLDWLSALINAHVDVAKDPYIIRLNVRKLTFNMTNFLIRSGKGESTFYFLPQQILKDYATEYDKYSGFYGVEIPAGKNPERLAFTKIWNDYYKKAKELSGGKKENLLNYLKDKGVGTNQRKTMFTVPHLRKQLQKTETFDWYYNQLLILKAYEELTPFSKSLSELTNLSQIDTKRFGNNFGLQSAFLDKWKQYMTEQAVFDNPLKVFTNTFLGKKMIDGLVFPRNAFQNVMIRLTPEFETLRSLIEYYTKGYAISDDTYINNITRAMEVSYKTKFFNQYVKDNQMGFRGMLFGKDSISRRLDRLKSDILQGKYPSLLGSDGSFSNVLINNIFSRPKEDDAELQGPDFIAYKPNKSGDNNLENEIIRAWEELYESDYKEVREFAKDLAIYSFYTSGDAFGKNNIFRYVPNSIREEIGYFDYIRELEKHPENVISQIDLQEVIRNLWWNDHVVPAIEYYKLDSSYETIEEEGRAVYRPVAHDDSGLFVTNKKGEQVEIPSIIYDESSKFRGIVGYNEAGNPIHYLYKKVKLDKNNDPRTTFLYKYIGIDENKVPVYQLINKKGLSYKGNVLVEFGFKKSSIGYNNIVLTGLDFTPSKAITYVQDLTPVKASLQTKIFNQAGEFNENALQTVATENVDLQNTEPLAYQEWSKTHQSRNGEAASQEAYQQYLDNFEYGAKRQISTKSRKTYTGMINSLEPNQIFVFGSNTQGRHGKGAALIAKNKFGAEYGNPEGPQGQSYAIITKDLTKRTHPSRTPEQIKEQIHNLYEYARENPDKEFLVAYSGTGQNLNAYSNQEMANMFSSEPIPDNIVFEQSFNELILTNQVSTVAKKPNTVPTTKIISGGQTGIDRLGLEIGRELGLETGGTTTPGYYTENGPDTSLQDFGVTEIAPELQAGRKGKEFYLPRTEQNVINSDGTVYFSTDEDSAGRIATQRFAKAHNKPFLLNPTSQELAQWLVDNNIGALNVAGNRGSKVSPEFDSQVRETIRNAFKSPTQQDLFAQEEVKPSETPTQFTELQQYANQVGLTEALPKVEEVKQAVEETKQIQDKYVYTFDDGLEVKLDFELNDQQKSALKELEAFVNGDDTSITLSGYAGTGKTTIMGIFNEYLKRRIQADIIFSAPTHRANAVTRQKTPNAKVITLQSLLGLRPDFDITEDVFDLHKLKFEQVAAVKIEDASIVIVDEASMIQDSLYDFLLEQIAAKGAQIIFVGDKGQLRPVKANNISKVFRNDGAQLQLTKVERTGDNPILKESTRVRNGEGLSYETDIAPNGQGVEYSSDKTRIREFVRTSLKEMKDSQDPLYFRVLAATNASVDAYNSAIRQILYGRRPTQLYEGELVMGYSNREYDSLRKKYKLMNSGDYVVQSVKPTTIQIDLTYPDRRESISMEGYKVTLKDAIDTSASSFTIDVVSNFETDENIIKVQEYIQTLWSMRKQLLAEGNPTAARSVIEKINNIQNRIHTMRDIKDANGRLKLRKSFDYGYAHTIHKSQGGTYSKVLINDSSINTFGFNDKNGQEVRQELKYVAVSRAKNYVMVQTLEKAKQQVVEDYDLDEEFVSATYADLKQAANDSAVEELDRMGKQRKKECE
jgi:signal recognition particle GTPase